MIIRETYAAEQNVGPLEWPAEGSVLAAETVPADRPVIRWENYECGVYRCEVRLVEESEGGFSVYVPGLPGVVSEGDSVREALDHISEALAGAIESYRQDGQDIPWQDPETPVPKGEISRWVLVHV